MKKALVVLVLLLAACSNGGPKMSPAAETLTQMCVREVSALYEKHSLPTTHAASDKPAECDKFMADNGITTKAQLEITLRQQDQALTAVDKP